MVEVMAGFTKSGHKEEIMRKVHEIDGIDIYEGLETAFFTFEDFVVLPRDLENVRVATIRKIKEWCKKNHQAYEALSVCCRSGPRMANEQYIDLSDIDAMIEAFAGTKLGEEALEEKRRRLAPPPPYVSKSDLPPEPPKPRIKEPGHVYILKAENGLFKIGKSKSVLERVEKIVSQSPVKISLVGSVAVEDRHEHERVLHAKFEDKRQIGEWFSLNENDVASILKFEG